MNIKTIRALRHIRRLNFHNCNKYISVAEHSFYVALIAREIAIDLELDIYNIGVVTDIALLHDVEESITGDIPYLVRREILNLKEIELKAEKEIDRSYVYADINHSYIYKLVEFADAYEFKMYLEEERKSGNMSLIEIEQETYGRLIDSDINDVSIQNKWISKLEKVDYKKLPDFMSHEGK